MSSSATQLHKCFSLTQPLSLGYAAECFMFSKCGLQTRTLNITWELVQNTNYWAPLKTYPEKAMAPHSSTLAWKIPWMEEPGGLQSMGSLWVGHDWATSLSLFTFMHWRRQWQPTPVFLPGESQGREAWWAAVYGVAQSRTQLKRLSSSSSRGSKTYSVLPPSRWFRFPLNFENHCFSFPAMVLRVAHTLESPV